MRHLVFFNFSLWNSYILMFLIEQCVISSSYGKEVLYSTTFSAKGGGQNHTRNFFFFFFLISKKIVFLIFIYLYFFPFSFYIFY